MTENLLSTEEITTRSLMAFQEAAMKSYKKTEKKIIENQRKGGSYVTESLVTLLLMMTQKIENIFNELHDLTKEIFQVTC